MENLTSFSKDRVDRKTKLLIYASDEKRLQETRFVAFAGDICGLQVNVVGGRSHNLAKMLYACPLIAFNLLCFLKKAQLERLF